MSSPDLSITSSVQEFVSPPDEYISVPIAASPSGLVPPPLKSTSGTTFLVDPDIALRAAEKDQSPSFWVDRPEKGNVKDSGWWLILDMFVRQKRWMQLAALDASSMMINFQEQRRAGAVLLKRSMDVMVALALLILLLPMLAVVALLIRLESRGPALFRHRRVGERGKEFELWKFRSMRIDTLKYERSPTSTSDPRLTRIGRLIRRVSFDEIPQLLNVLKGEMSLVGPRPEMAFIVNQYTSMERRRLLVKPGITGLWQISSGRMAPIHHNLQYDLYYIQHENALLDVAILLRTISAVIRGIGAI
jgi:lipopolysaccharide/colanic/teichoic acid biosynthesis glycosyltransferase